jgi:hypothetical protein
MAHKELINKLVHELSYRVGIPNVKDKNHQSIMSEILSEWGEFDAKKRIFEFLTEAEPEKTPEDEKYVNTGGSGWILKTDQAKYDKEKKDFDGQTFTKEGPGVYKEIPKDSKTTTPDAEKGAAVGKGTDYANDAEELKDRVANKDKLDKEDSGSVDDESEKGTPPKKLSKAEDKQRVTKIHQESEKLSKKVYGEDLNSPTLQNSVTSDEILNQGHSRDKYYTAPGNAGSAFNELLSNELAIVLSKNPNLSEEEATSILYHRFSKTKLAKQQSKDTSVESPTKNQKGVVPDGVEPHIWKSCIIAARSGRAKFDRATKGTKVAQEQVGFGSDTTTLTFGGTSRNEGKKDKSGNLKPDSKTPDDVVSDLEALKNELDKSKAVYVYDEELGKMVKIPHDVIKKWVDDSGAGENAADTVVLTKDENGNVIFDGWSDKKGLGDLQGNSTLNDDYTKQDTNVKGLLDSGQIDESTSETAKQIVSAAKKKSKEIEESYKQAPKKELEYFKTLSGEQRKAVLKEFEAQDIERQRTGQTNHVREAMNSYKPPAKTYDELLDKLAEENSDGNTKTPKQDKLKIIGRAATVIRKNLKAAGEEVPPGLDTKQILSRARKQALDLQKETVDKLNEYTGKTSSGKTKRLGDILGFQETVDFLHIDKIETPKSDDDHKAYLKRNTQLVMGGVAVKPENLKDCLGVKDLADYEDNFEVITEERITTARDNKNVITGKVVLIYAINKGDNKKTFVGEKVYRSKDGPEGKTSNTIKWSPEMQGCFDSK